ncbi:uncharacterized protein CELE_Y57G7A.3 [Caenorhabditis elegans]|uniref:Secreted protein n=1 Tax=Caenorhabditis elegans TaxID=6239 RepID=Q7KPD3_CAEEL|nr:Secreted protein [Caenorhabditis elegans]CCD71445.1 Secreted protein [Caenorhabditis elegans]|eukprot:NP_001022485.1 Uncharacterized protein CELE_Y57G7A.3 [Caenorhabditis elegans]
MFSFTTIFKSISLYFGPFFLLIVSIAQCQSKKKFRDDERSPKMRQFAQTLLRNRPRRLARLHRPRRQKLQLKGADMKLKTLLQM